MENETRQLRAGNMNDQTKTADELCLVGPTSRSSSASGSPWRRAVWLLLLLVVALSPWIAMAQDEVPAEAYVPAVPSPAALANPAVRAILERGRTTPADYLQATTQLLELGEPALARNAFRELLALELDDQAKADLVGQVGPAALLRLSREIDFDPEVAQFVESSMAAAAQQATSQERIAKLIEQLGSETDAVQRRAVAELAGVGQPAVVPLIRALADEGTNDTQRAGVQAALLRLGPLAERPLLATLQSGDAPLQAEAAMLLASLATPQAAPLMAQLAVQSSGGAAIEQSYQALTGQLAGFESATGLLARTIENIEGGAPVFAPELDGSVTYWVWSSKPVDNQQPVPISLSVADANLMYRAALAAQLAQLQPGIPSLESKALRLSIESVDVLGRHGFAVGYPADKIADLSADRLDRVLIDAMEENQVASATLALAQIAERRDPGVLMTSDGRPSPTARALEHPHPTIVAAGLDAIAAIDCPTPFPGSSKVCSAIVRLATATGHQEVLVGAPRLDVAASWAGGLASKGLEGQIAATGQDLIDRAGMRADVELVLIDMAIGRPAIRDVVFQLRRQPSTGLIPIGLFARDSQLPTARRIAFEHERVMAFPRPHTDPALTDMATQLVEQLPPSWPTAQERLAQADRAIEVMNQLLGSNRGFYRLRAASGMIAQSVRPDGSNEAVWQLLARLGTHDSQVALLSYVSGPALAIESRRAAAKAFAASVERFGVRLTSGEIARQYDRYNASEADTRESQEVLGLVLDSIEAGRTKRTEASY